MFQSWQTESRPLLQESKKRVWWTCPAWTIRKSTAPTLPNSRLPSTLWKVPSLTIAARPTAARPAKDARAVKNASRAKGANPTLARVRPARNAKRAKGAKRTAAKDVSPARNHKERCYD